VFTAALVHVTSGGNRHFSPVIVSAAVFTAAIDLARCDVQQWLQTTRYHQQDGKIGGIIQLIGRATCEMLPVVGWLQDYLSEE